MRNINNVFEPQKPFPEKSIEDKFEIDSCATGVLISAPSSEPSRANIENSLDSLDILPHRGGSIPKIVDGKMVYIGDGAGVSCDIPWDFYNGWMAEKGMTKPKDQPIAIGNFFLPNDSKKRLNAKNQIRGICEAHGVEMLSYPNSTDKMPLYWRDIKFDSADSEEVKQIKLQNFRQCFLAPKKSSKMSEAQFQDALIKITNAVQSYAQIQNEEALKKGEEKPNLAIASLSTETVVYKGMILPGEVRHFADLKDLKFTPKRVIYHIRQSTNTSPSPGNSQPFLKIAHNGELNSVKGNARKNHRKARGWSDSRTFNEHIENMLLQGTDIVETITTLMPPAGGKFSAPVKEMLGDIKSKGLEYNGPAHMVFSHGKISGAKLDSSALRPSRYVIARDKDGHKHLYVGSEDLFSAKKLKEMGQKVVGRGMLKAGEMIIMEDGIVKKNQQILEELATRYKKTEQEIVTIKSATPEISLEPKIALGKKELEIKKYQLLPLFGGEIKKIAMGDDTDPTATDPRAIPTLAELFKQKFSQVSSPPLDSGKERSSFNLEMFLGDKTKKQDRKLLKINSPFLKLGELDSIQAAAGDSALTVDMTFDSKELSGKSDEEITKILRAKIDAICLQVAAQVKAGKSIVILDDSKVAKDRMALPDIMVLGAVSSYLYQNNLEKNASLIVNSTQVNSAHHFSVLSSLGAAAVNPAGAYEFAKNLVFDKSDPEKSQKEYQKHCSNFHKAVEKAHLVTMAKYGITSAETYCDARLMETLAMDLDKTDNSPSCLGNAFSSIDRCGDFYGVFDASKVLLCAVASHQESYGDKITTSGHFAYNAKGVSHSYNPTVIKAVRDMTNSYRTSVALFEKYTQTSAELQTRLDLVDQDPNWDFNKELGERFTSKKRKTLELKDTNDLIEARNNENDRLLNSLFFVDKVFEELKRLLDLQKQEKAERDDQRKRGEVVTIKGETTKQIEILRRSLFVQREGDRDLSFDKFCDSYKKNSDDKTLKNNLYQYLGYGTDNIEQIQQWVGLVRDGNLEAADQLLKELPEKDHDRIQFLYDKHDTNAADIRTLKSEKALLDPAIVIDATLLKILNKVRDKGESEAEKKELYKKELRQELQSLKQKIAANDIAPKKNDKGAFLEEEMNARPLDEPFKAAMKIIADNKKAQRVTIADHIDILQSNTSKPADEEMQKVSDILKRHFVTGGMSHGALTLSAHNDVSKAAELTGSKACTGEGGKPVGQLAKIVQIASGRFGLNPEYFSDAETVEIKIVQGAKPGEGGQLPGGKVSIGIAAKRGCTPGIDLISPPPHHDIYSIEDLQELIHDIKELKPGVKVAVKLCASEGIDEIAIGVAKSGADIINIASASGGTGAASVDAIKQTGLPAEVGLKMVHKALSEAGIRNAVELQVSGFPNTPEGVLLMAILGGDILESGTTDLMMLGCDMHRKCGIPGACGPGITNNEAGYQGSAEELALYKLNMAKAVQEKMQELGIKSLTELRGRVDLISAESLRGKVSDKFIEALLENVENFKQLSAAELAVFKDNANKGSNLKTYAKLREVDSQGMDLDAKMKGSESFVIDGGELNVDNRTFGATLVFEHYKTLGTKLASGEMRAEDHCTITTTGNSGQSHGAFNTHGICLVHEGPTQDGFGKSMSGGVLVIKVPESETEESGVDSQSSIYTGNATLYGASGGKAFIAGAGSRCGILMKGATLVVNGDIGDYGCEYMTSGSFVALGKVGDHFGSGMYGGVAVLYNQDNYLDTYEMSEDVRDARTDEQDAYLDALKILLAEDLQRTGDKKVENILANWETEKKNFKIIIPKSLDKIQTISHWQQVDDSFKQRDNVQQFGEEVISPFEKVWLQSRKLEIENNNKKSDKAHQEPNVTWEMSGECNVLFHKQFARRQEHTSTEARAVGGLGYPDENLSEDINELKKELFSSSKKCSCDAVTCTAEDTPPAVASDTGCPVKKNPNLINATLKDASLPEDERIRQAFLMQIVESPFPGFTGSACPAPCQDSCTHSAADEGNAESVKIKRIELLLHKIALIQGLYDQAEVFKKPEKMTDKKVMIIGSGPSALEAAYHLAKQGVQVEIFEKSDKIGGLLRYGIPDHKLQKDVIDFYVDKLKEMGVAFHINHEVDLKTVKQDSRYKDEKGKAFDLYLDARGIANTPIVLDAKLSRTTVNEGGNHSLAMDFLEYCNRFFYASRNGQDLEHPFTKFNVGKQIVVMGAGDTAEDVKRSIKKLNDDLADDDPKKLEKLETIGRQPEETERAAIGSSFPHIREARSESLHSDLHSSSSFSQKPQLAVLPHYNSAPQKVIFDQENPNQILSIECGEKVTIETGFSRGVRKQQDTGVTQNHEGSFFITAFGFKAPEVVEGTAKTLDEIRAGSVVPIGDVASKTGFVFGGRELIVNAQASAKEVVDVALLRLGVTQPDKRTGTIGNDRPNQISSLRERQPQPLKTRSKVNPVIAPTW